VTIAFPAAGRLDGAAVTGDAVTVWAAKEGRP
jgi:hypothetical protein